MATQFKPTLYLKKECPFCFKLRLALLEAGMLSDVDIEEFAEGSPQETTIRNELSPHFEKVSFPSAQVAPGEFMNDSDALIAHFLSLEQIDPASLPTLQAYIQGPFTQLLRLFKENKELKKRDLSWRPEVRSSKTQELSSHDSIELPVIGSRTRRHGRHGR